MSQTLTELKNRIQNEKGVGDEIIAILIATNEKQISTDRAFLHSAFYKMIHKCKLLQIKNIIFDLSTLFPYSEELEAALFRLEASGILEYYFTNDPYYIVEGLNQKSDFGQEEQQEISACASILSKELKKRKIN